jgi:carbamoyltransferase
MTNPRFDDLFDSTPPRSPGEPLNKQRMDMARSVQAVTEDVVLRLCRTLHRRTGERNLCMAGGVALNCVANGRVLREGPFENVWIQPASGDAGGAIGVALAISHVQGQKRLPLGGRPDRMAGACLGPGFGADAIHAQLHRFDAVFHDLEDDALIETVASALEEEKIVGWFQGRMEFGPRALGNRSILADPRPADMQRRLNMRIKYRESFRPFAPAVLREKVSDYFELSCDSPYMQLVSRVCRERRREPSAEEAGRQGFDKLDSVRSEIPAVTHVDYSARIQTVDRETNPRFRRLLEAFHERTGCAVLVNTSFNLFGDPIVCTPEDAYRCFMGSEMDVLVLGNSILHKREQR